MDYTYGYMIHIKHQKGFTIVELLIVIVVIAILAAISIVAYNGIQTRAENTKTINGVTAYAKALSLYAADKGVYPTVAGYPCMGTPSANSCGRTTTVTGGCDFSGGTSTDTSFDSLLVPTYVSAKPALSDQTMNCSGSIYKGGYVNPNSTDVKNFYMQFYLKNTECPTTLGTGKVYSTNTSGEVRMCAVSMPSL